MSAAEKRWREHVRQWFTEHEIREVLQRNERRQTALLMIAPNDRITS